MSLLCDCKLKHLRNPKERLLFFPLFSRIPLLSLFFFFFSLFARTQKKLREKETGLFVARDLCERLLRPQAARGQPAAAAAGSSAAGSTANMSRFLEYGVFVPDPSKEKSSSSSPPATGQWARVGGKWCKVGPDGQPLVPPTPKSFSQTVPAGGGGGGREGVEAQGGEGAAADPFSRTEGAGGEAWEQRRKQQKEDGLPMMTNGDIYGHDGDDGADDDDDSSPTIPRTRSSSSAAGSAAPRPPASAAAGSRGRGVYGSNNSGASSNDDDDAGGRGGGSANNSGGLTVDASSSSNGGGSTGTGAELDADGAAARQKAMLTPGLSRSYSTDEIVGKFFGGGDTAAAAAAASAAGGGGGSGKAGSVGRGSGEFESGFGANSACVGERAAAPGAGGVNSGGKHGRTGSGSSNTANSPVNKTSGAEDSEPVETRDVACQWDGSECFSLLAHARAAEVGP